MDQRESQRSIPEFDSETRWADTTLYPGNLKRWPALNGKATFHGLCALGSSSLSSSRNCEGSKTWEARMELPKVPCHTISCSVKVLTLREISVQQLWWRRFGSAERTRKSLRLRGERVCCKWTYVRKWLFLSLGRKPNHSLSTGWHRGAELATIVVW